VFVFDVSLLHDGESDDDEDDEQFGGLDDMIFDLISFTLFLLCPFRFSLYVCDSISYKSLVAADSQLLNGKASVLKPSTTINIFSTTTKYISI